MEMADLNDLSTLALAYGDVEDDAPPLFWTPAAVQNRLVDAFDVVSKTGGRIGPRTNVGYWPEILRVVADFNGYDLDNPDADYYVDRSIETDAALNRQISSLRLSLADEALGWCARYLEDSPMQADALQFWALGVSRGLGEKGFAKLLRRRALVADALVERRKHDLPDKVTIYEEDAEQAARKIAAWANEALAKEHAELTRPLRRDEKRKTPIQVRKAKARIKMAAHIRFKREIKVVKAVERETFVRRVDVMPNRVFSVRRLLYYRTEGATLMAERLRRAGVQVR